MWPHRKKVRSQAARKGAGTSEHSPPGSQVSAIPIVTGKNEIGGHSYRGATVRLAAYTYNMRILSVTGDGRGSREDSAQHAQARSVYRNIPHIKSACEGGRWAGMSEHAISQRHPRGWQLRRFAEHSGSGSQHILQYMPHIKCEGMGGDERTRLIPNATVLS